MKIYAATQKGVQKAQNEDRVVLNQNILSMGIHECECTAGFVAVADGVGGNNAGAVASQFVAEELGKCDHTIKNLTEINRKLIERSRADEALAGMATTLALMDFTEDSAKITYVGNTRVYAVVNEKYLKQLTRDDTTLEYLLATRQLDSFTAESFERKNEITACFGADNPALLKLKQIDVSGQDMLIVTSDGIHDHVSIDEMEDVERQRILTARLGDIVTLGRCNDGDLEIDGEIKWIVLAEENGKKLIVSENILAHKKYHQTLKGITWEASDLREWLNTNFYAKFFTEQEKILISENLLKNKNNSSNNIEAGNDTVDKIFVLSFYEANRYFASTEKRSMKDWWWLRTPGTQADRATIVTEGGYLLATGKDVDKIGGVRPAMWVG